MSQVEMQYDEFLSSIGQKIPNADVNLLVKIMYLERKLTDAYPKVDLHIEYKANIDPTKKQELIRSKYGFPTQRTISGLTAVGRMNVDIIEEISKDSDIQHISGTATPASY